MQKMLVDNADRLTIDSVIPVGEAFDDIFTGTTTSSDPQVTLRFKLARDLWAVADQRQPAGRGRGLAGLAAEHRHNADDIVLRRVFTTRSNSPLSVRTAIQRRVNRKFHLLRALKHEGIVIPRARRTLRW